MESLAIVSGCPPLEKLQPEKSLLNNVLASTHQPQLMAAELINLREENKKLQEQLQEQLHVNSVINRYAKEEIRLLRDQLIASTPRQICPICGDPNCPQSRGY